MAPPILDQVTKGFVELSHPTLSAYYERLRTLRTYLSDQEVQLRVPEPDDADSLDSLLDGTIIGTVGASDMVVAGVCHPQVTLTQQEAVDRILADIISRLGSRTKQIAKMNVLTTGYQRSGQEQAPNAARSGLDTIHVNNQVSAIRSDTAWRVLHKAIGTSAFIAIISRSCLFIPLANNCFYQMCGLPLSITKTLAVLLEETTSSENKKRRAIGKQAGREHKKRKLEGDAKDMPSRPGVPEHESRHPVDIKIVRNRMFYGKWGHKSGQRSPSCGFPPNHILHCLEPPPARRALPVPTPSCQLPHVIGYDYRQEARTLLRYMFPRAHGLNNVFDINVQDRDWTGRAPFYTDYSDRRDEITVALINGKGKTPKRLKVAAMALIEKLIINHRKCDYWQLRAICCPSKTRCNPSGRSTASRHQDYVMRTQSVSRYAQLVCKVVIPPELWGSERNQDLVLSHIDAFVCARRFESLSVHQVLQDFRLGDCKWLRTHSNRGRTTCDESIQARRLMDEMVYWFFDSFLVPLLKNTFYITETAATKYATTYYRLDDWETLCKPVYGHLITASLTRLPEGRQTVLRQDLHQHTVLRLLPKAQGLRPISNLGKRLRKESASGNVTYMDSVNDTLSGPFQVLTYEKTRHADILESSLFGMYDIYGKLKDFKSRMTLQHGHLPDLHFVKVDVNKAFDTIDQTKLLAVLDEILDGSEDYVTTRYSQILPPSGRAPVLWAKRATPAIDLVPFAEASKTYADRLRNAIFVDQANQSKQDRASIIRILRSHVKNNLIKVGRNFYGQKVGIPQGSKVSSMLCSFFYGHMERENLTFARDDEALLVRIIDDFLYVSSSEAKCRRFLARMLRGQPDYGCFVSAPKSLATFATASGVPQLSGSSLFPFCGMMIDIRTLDIHIDIRRSFGLHVKHSLTVKTTTGQGKHFAGWLKRMLENHNHIIYNDTSLSSRSTVVANIYTNFLLAAMKTVHYLNGLTFDQTKSGGFAYRSIDEAIRHTSNASQGHTRSRVGQHYKAQSSITQEEFVWIAKHAFRRVFAARPTELTGLIEALSEDVELTWSRTGNTSTGVRTRPAPATEALLQAVWSQVAHVLF